MNDFREIFLRGREPKEITLKNLSKIIHARVVEIVEQVYLEIKNYGHEEQKKKLIAGIVLTGGGSQLKHLKQLVEYITGMDTRIGYPNEHLAGDSDSETTSPLYATAVGLVMNSLEHRRNEPEAQQDTAIVEEEVIEEQPETAIETDEEEEIVQPKEKKIRKSIFDTWAEKFKDFLDNAE
jgi:cell division protein FtsA